MIELDIGRFLLGALAIAAAAPCIVLACIDHPPQRGLPKGLIAVSLVAAIAFVAAGVVVLEDAHDFALFGLLIAAAEMCAAGAIWSARSRRGGGGGGGWREPPDDDDGPPGPEPSVPEHYWERWEESLRDHLHIGRR